MEGCRPAYLAGVSSLDLITVPHPAITNLAAIPTGPIPPNPADLLSSRKLTELIAELRTRYKFVVIDSPPIMAATDAVILSVSRRRRIAGGDAAARRRRKHSRARGICWRE